MLVYTCPKCGKDLQFTVVATYPPINVAECPNCGWREEKGDKIERIPYKAITVGNDVYSKDEVITILTELQQEIEENVLADDPDTILTFLQARETCVAAIQQKINELRGNDNGETNRSIKEKIQ